MFGQESPQSVSRWPVVRVLSGSKIEVTLLSGDWVRLATHYYCRTFLCPEVDECDACSLLPSRPYWYLPVLVHATRRASLLELSAAGSADLEQKIRFTGSALVPGVQVELSRRSQKAPVRSEVLGSATKAPLAKIHEWVSPLMALYKLPPLNVGETVEAYGDRVRSKVLERAKLAAASLRASSRGRVISRQLA